MRVLMVEDDDAIAVPLARGLEREGLDVARGRHRAAALGGAGYDVVLLDLGLPDIDGFEVCRRLRARSDGARSSSSPPAATRSTASSASSSAPTTTS